MAYFIKACPKQLGNLTLGCKRACGRENQASWGLGRTGPSTGTVLFQSRATCFNRKPGRHRRGGRWLSPSLWVSKEEEALIMTH